jgi:Domain of unknown function (DUF397)
MEESVDLRWRKSSYSGNGGGNCVEVASNLPHIVAIRDSKNPNGPRLTCSREAWSDFVQSVKEDEFNF